MQDRVAGLMLSGLGLEGTLPPLAIGSLANLAFIDLRSNPRLSGTLPSEFARLTGLRALMASDTAISGTLPADLSHTLQQLDLTSARLSGTLPPSLGNVDPRLTGANTYKLCDNRISGTIPETLTKLPLRSGQRQFVDTYNSNAYFSFKSSSYGTWDTLQLGCGSGDLSGKGNQLSGTIPSGFQEPRGMEAATIDFSFNRLSGTLSESAAGIHLLGNLELSGTLPTSYVMANPNWQGLFALDFARSRLSGTLPDDMNADWAWVNFSDTAVSGTLPTTLNCLGKHGGACVGGGLSHVDMTRTAISGTIPLQLGKLQVYKLQIQQTALSGTLPFEACGAGTMMLLGGNALSGTLPSWLTGSVPQNAMDDSNEACLNFYGLELAGNRLSGTLPPFVDVSGENHATPEALLDVAQNLISGTLPATLAELAPNTIAVQNNRMSGSIPASLRAPFPGCATQADLGCLKYCQLSGPPVGSAAGARPIDRAVTHNNHFSCTDDIASLHCTSNSLQPTFSSPAIPLCTYDPPPAPPSPPPSPSPLPSPPLPAVPPASPGDTVVSAVEVDFKVAGVTLETFDRASFLRRLSVLLAVNADLISLTVASPQRQLRGVTSIRAHRARQLASEIDVHATVQAKGAASADAMVATLSSTGQAGLESALAVTLDGVPAASRTTLILTSPPPAFAGNQAAAVVGGTLGGFFGGLLLTLCILAAAVRLLRSRRHHPMVRLLEGPKERPSGADPEWRSAADYKPELTNRTSAVEPESSMRSFRKSAAVVEVEMPDAL